MIRGPDDGGSQHLWNFNILKTIIFILVGVCVLTVCTKRGAVNVILVVTGPV